LTQAPPSRIGWFRCPPEVQRAKPGGDREEDPPMVARRDAPEMFEAFRMAENDRRRRAQESAAGDSETEPEKKPPPEPARP